MNGPALEKAAALLAVVAVSQAWARWRVGVRERAAADAPLFDPIALEIALAPRTSEEDNGALDALREILRQHNHCRDASALPASIAGLYILSEPRQQETIAAAISRLAATEDSGLARLREVAADVLETCIERRCMAPPPQ